MKRIRTILAIISSLSFGWDVGELAKKGNRQPKKPGVCVCSDWTSCGCWCNNPWRGWYPGRTCPCKRVFFRCEGCQ